MFYSLDEMNYSLVLEHADGGTLRNYLRDNTKTFKWKKFAEEIANAISWLHYKKIIHGDLVSIFLLFCVIHLYFIINTFFFYCSIPIIF